MHGRKIDVSRWEGGVVLVGGEVMDVAQYGGLLKSGRVVTKNEEVVSMKNFHTKYAR